MKICFILGGKPAYSETFLISKMNGLYKSGDDIYFSAGSKTIKTLKGKQLKGFTKGSGLAAYKILFVALCMNLIKPGNAIKFFKLERASGKSLKDSLKSFLLNAHLLPHKFDWIHFTFGTLILGNENLAKATGAKCSLSFRGFDIVNYPLKHPGCYERAWQVLDKVHVISDDIWNLAKANGLPDYVSVEKIFPAINTTIFAQTQNLIPQVNSIASTGRLLWKKGYRYAIEAIALLKAEGYNLKLHIAGSGDEYERLAFQAHQLNVAENIVFEGKIDHEDMPDFLQKHTIYIQPSLQEGFCNSVIEAQAAGLFCIVSDAGGLPENVLHEQTGFVVLRRNAEALAAAIKRAILLSPEERNVYKENALRHVEKNFNIDNQIQQFRKFYETMSGAVKYER